MGSREQKLRTSLVNQAKAELSRDGISTAKGVRSKNHMNATEFDILWKQSQFDVEVSAEAIKGVEQSPHKLNFIGKCPSSDRSLRCPHCHAVIYSRRHNLCGVCNRMLPEKLLFSPAQAQRIGQLMQTERQKHRSWMAK